MWKLESFQIICVTFYYFVQFYVFIRDLHFTIQSNSEYYNLFEMNLLVHIYSIASTGVS